MQLKALGLEGSESIEAVRVATAKMSAEDTAAVLAKTKLSAAEQEEILVENGLTETRATMIASANTMSATDLEAALTKADLSEVITAEALANSGLTEAQIAAAVAASNLTAENLAAILATTALTKEQQIQILVNKGLTEAQAEAIVTTAAQSAENVNAALKTDLLTKSTVSLKTVTKGLWATLKANPMIGFIAVLSGLIALTVKLAGAAKEASEEADELKEKSTEESEKAQEEIKSVDELINKYKELAKSDTQDTSVRQQIRDLQGQITDLVGNQADNLDLVNGKLDDEIAKLNQIKESEAKNAVNKAITAYHDAKSSHNKAIGQDSALFGILGDYAYAGDNEDDVLKVLNDHGFTNAKKGGFFNNTTYIPINVDSDGKVLEGATEKMEYVKKMRDTIEKYYKDYASSNIWNELNKQVENFEKYSTDMKNAAKDLVDAEVLSASYDNSLSKINVNSLDNYMDYRDKLIKIVKDSPNLSEAIDSGDLTDKDITKSVDDYLSTLEGFSDYYNEWYNKFESDTAKHTKKVKETVNKTEWFKGNKDRQNKFSNWIDKLDDSDKDIVYKISTEFTTDKVKTQLENLGEGGTVDLTLRPQVDNSELKKAGWDVDSEGTATVFTSTQSNKDNTIAINFTPIVTDDKGNYVKTLSPEALEEYAQGVINGTRKDDLNLQIGAKFTGQNAVKQAVQAAEEIHNLQDFFYLKGDPSDFDLNDWKTALSDYKQYVEETGESVQGAFETLMTTKGDSKKPSFIERVDDYTDKMSNLNDAFEKFQKGELENKDIIKLTEDFPKLAGRTDDLDVAINELKGNLNEEMLSDFNDQFGNMDTQDDIDKLKAFQQQVLKLGDAVGDTDFSIDIDVESDNMDKLYSAMKESVTSTGLTAESIDKLTDRYKNLKDFNAPKLFEKTANGIHLNTKELRLLESQYENQIKT